MDNNCHVPTMLHMDNCHVPTMSHIQSVFIHADQSMPDFFFFVLMHARLFAFAQAMVKHVNKTTGVECSGLLVHQTKQNHSIAREAVTPPC